MSWERVWMILAILLVTTAGVFLWRNNLSPAFVSAALGACAWFLSYRSQLRSQLPDNSESDESESREEPVPEERNED